MPKSLRIRPDWIQNQPTWMKVSATLVFGVIMMAAAFLSVQDYQTSRLGYLMLPSQKLDPETTAMLVGLLPQAFQIALAWIAAGRREGRKLVLFLWLLAFIPDFATDLHFKMQGIAWSGEFLPDLAVGALVWAETFMLFTFGSEFMLMFGWSNIGPLIAPTVGGALGGFAASVRELWHAAGEAAAEAGRQSGTLFGLETEEVPTKKGRGGTRRK